MPGVNSKINQEFILSNISRYLGIAESIAKALPVVGDIMEGSIGAVRKVLDLINVRFHVRLF